MDVKGSWSAAWIDGPDTRPDMRLVMTLTVRDELDVLEFNLRYHFARGVDFVVAMDTGSVDGSVELLRRYQSAGLLHLVPGDPEDHFRNQGVWQTRLARLAATDFGADWVINNDADEFWWPVEGDLADVFGAVDSRYGSLLAPRSEFVPLPGDTSFLERLTIRETGSRTPPKVAHRGLHDVQVSRGSHSVARERDSQGSGGRPGLRGRWAPPRDARLIVPAPRWPVRILHFPIRAYEQFEVRTARLLFGEGYAISDRRRQRLKEAYETGRLAELYAEVVADDAAVEAALRGGEVTVDTSLRDFMRGCPDPLASSGGARAAAVTPSADDVDEATRSRELAAIQHDLMHAWAKWDQARERTHWEYRERARRLRAARKQLSKVERKLAKSQAQVRSLQASGGARPARIWGKSVSPLRALAGRAARRPARPRQPPPPAPFVIGAVRSGTTLLRLMLDSHPDLAIPPETHFVPALIEASEDPGATAGSIADLLVSDRRWQTFGLDADEMRQRLLEIRPFDVSEGIRAFYGAYAEKHGKTRWGDKTPQYARKMRVLDRRLPEAHFVHLIRDGRDAALSRRALKPDDRPIAYHANYWKSHVHAARRRRSRVGHYLELRYEDLVMDTEAQLRRICDFLELPFDARMLDYHQGASDRVGEFARAAGSADGARTPERSTVPSAEYERRRHRLTSEPPRADRVARWRREMSAADIAEYERLAGDLLAELGYELATGQRERA
jgi:hypothetical protein